MLILQKLDGREIFRVTRFIIISLIQILSAE